MSDPVTTPQPPLTTGTFVATAAVSFVGFQPSAIASPAIRDPRAPVELFLTFRQLLI